MTRYEGGDGIRTTSVHPSWHQTGIIKGGEEALAKQGIVPDPPKNVSDLVVKQVLSGKSGRLIVPKSEEGKTSLRHLPLWLQDILYGQVWQRKDRAGFVKK
jgi:all-trans-retinol dehydrogenase (NAD+)